ncbi:MAG: hypothetical protein GYA57_15225 [Myxococcales bacterium]|nr:hypothetical protein [Myxococcales bacterium]
MTSPRKTLIEAAMPLDRINEESVHEGYIYTSADQEKERRRLFQVIGNLVDPASVGIDPWFGTHVCVSSG